MKIHHAWEMTTDPFAFHLTGEDAEVEVYPRNDGTWRVEIQAKTVGPRIEHNWQRLIDALTYAQNYIGRRVDDD